MRKFILAVLVFTCLFMQEGRSQIVLKIANVEVDPGTPTATVDVTIDGFTNLISAQFSINYDSLVIGLNSVTNLNPTLNLSATPGVNFGFPGTGNIKKGQMTFSWNDGALTPRTLPNGTRLFSIVFNVLGGAGSMSAVTQTNLPLKIEYVNNDFATVNNFTSQAGSVRVRGGGGGGGGFMDPCPDIACTNPTNLQLSGDTIIGKKGDKVKVGIRARNFKSIAGGDGTFSFDSTKLKFVSITSEYMSSAIFVTPISTPTPSPNGIIRFNYLFDGVNTVTIPDNAKAFDIEFEIIGDPDDTTRICVGKNPPPEMLWIADINGNTVEVPFCTKGGTVFIRDITPAPPVKLKLNTGQGQKGSTVCLDLRVENFTMIRNMQFSINWDPTILKYVSTGMYDLKNLSQSGFNQMTNSLILTWNSGDNSVVTLANNHKIFQICFELIGPCDTTSAVQITNTPRVIEINGIFDNQNDFEFDTEVTNGAITIIPCEGVSTCTVNGTTNATCFGASNGGATATVTPAQGQTNCMCVWKNSQGAIVKSSTNLSDCNLANVPAGVYTLELICSSAQQCTSTATIGQPDNINIPATGVTNVSCSGKGSINVTGITGGTQPYTPTWNPNVGNGFNVTNLDAGTYNLTITDLRGCTGTQSYTITDTRTALSATASTTAVKCFGGNDGTITVSPSGGCPPYTFTGNLTNLTAGNYTITVTDASVPANTTTVSATVTQPAAALAVVSTTVNADFGQNNGSITLVISGGTPNYTIVWQSTATQIAQNANPATNLRPGFYNVTITDANGCSTVASNIEVGEGPDVPKQVTFETVAVSSNFNGFGVDCHGRCTGVISGRVASGTLPVRLVIKNGNVVIRELNVTALGNFEFNQLCAGNYVIDGINSAGTTTNQTITITSPTRLTAGTPVVECTNGENNDGSITVNVNNTGVPPYSYQWSDPISTTDVLDNVGVGTYGVTVTDANNCPLIINNIDVRPCGVDPDECGVGSQVLTPDGNQQNDVFIITCAEDLNGSLAIYDRWGRLIYNKAPYDNSFIGIDNDDNIVNEGAYVWIYEVNYGNGVREVFSGTLTILK